MEPIETEYKGYRFRSRLEARWAVFLDALNVQYQYEPEGFRFEDGTRYLPDFYLPNKNLWIEVKGGEPNEREIEKAEELCWGTGEDVLVTAGDMREGSPSESGPWHRGVFFVEEYLPEEELIDEVENHDAPADYMERRMERGGFPAVETLYFGRSPRTMLNVEAHEVEEATRKMRSARFEHGENGAGRV